MHYYIALDIGGTNIKYGIISEKGEFLYQSSCPTRVQEGVTNLVSKVKGTVQKLLDSEYPISGIGISTAGVVDTTTGEIIYAGPTIPGYKGTNLKTTLETVFQIPTTVNNDVNAAALGEAWLGAGKSVDTFFCLTLGTGIGGALILNKELYRGHHFRSGEIGYMGKQHDKDKTYEQKAATSALIENAKQQLDIEEIDGLAIFEKAKAGNRQCEKIVREWVHEIAKGLADIICVIDPGVIIIGGAVSQQGKYLMDLIKESLRSYLPEVFVDSMMIKPTERGNTAGMLGAVYPFVK